MYEKLAGMTGTAETEASELKGTYGLDVVPIPTNKPIVRDDAADLVYKTEDGKFGAVVDDMLERYKVGQPVLVGTASVEHSEKLSGILNKRGIPHQVLNAKQHTREAHVVAQAGQIGAITVATNMAGRGVDIVLGGNPEIGAEIEARAEGLDPDSEEGRQRVEELQTKFEPEMQAQGDKVREVGGLHVLGTERHESRRIDNQLRGRAGRQGDPGSSRFYLSLEDDLMRLFATGAMNWVMDKALPEDVPIESKMVSKSVERAQNTVEQRNAEIRRNVLKYDEVMNEQRKVIYKRRDQILDGEDLREEADEALDRAVSHVIETFCVADFSEEWDIDGLLGEVRNIWPTQLTAEQLQQADVTDELRELLLAEAAGQYAEREDLIGAEVIRDLERQVMLRILDRRWRDHLQDMDYLRDGIGLRAMGQKDPLMEWQREGFEMFGQMMDGVSTDFVTYVLNMNIQIKPPEEQVEEKSDVADVSYSAPESPVLGITAGKAAQPTDPAALPSTGPAPNEPQANTPVVKSDWDKTWRNEPCPCGSGKKYKHCHGR
jgi:preprotein translocase subunit SecA